MFIACLFTIAASSVAQTRQPVPIPGSPKDMKYFSLRGVI